MQLNRIWRLFLLFLAGHASAAVTPLFDGKSLKGWEGDLNWWRVEDATIRGGFFAKKVPENMFIATTRDYTNFIFKTQFKLAGTNGFINSGVQIRSQRVPKSTEMAGYQCDLGDPSWWGSIYDESRRNKLMAQSDMAAINKVLKRGDWNSYEIRAEGRRIRTYLNGVLGVDYTEQDTKIIQWGKLGFQIHGGGAVEASFKDITIEELPPVKESPLSALDEQKSFTLPAGFTVDLIASEPELAKPITVVWDDSGRMWTMTALEYPVDGNENAAKAESLYRNGGKDKVLVFDALKPGKTDGPLAGTPRVFADGLAIPLGLLPYRDGAFVHHGTEVVLLRDTNGDGKADKREVILSGFGIQDSHLMPHQFTYAPGGWLYLAQGAFNYSKIRTRDDVVVQFDQTKLARFRPDGSKFEILTHGPCNIWGLVITRFGETWVQEANDYGYPMMPFEPGVNYPGCGDTKFRPYAPMEPSIADFRMGGTGLSGLALCEDTDAFPREWKDVMFVANPITRQVQAIKVHRESGGYRLEKLPDFLTTTDEWFRPVAIHFGPDGCLYVVDWYNKIISHNEVPRNHPDRDKTRGRVWRVRPRDYQPAAIPNIARSSNAELLESLVKGNKWAWNAALHQIAQRPAPDL
ncbi:MAG TPA: PVC-type heme-binding CxxCH protein, partial [Candidatus Saccharimonadales bacterium]|nr:PVC-type heme-binding CxxCH protein [Candidatus Saccharimonadales bacterium]